MTFNDFIIKYNGQSVDIDGFPSWQPYQCTDLAKRYTSEVWGLVTSPFLNKQFGYKGGGAADAVENWGAAGNFISPNDADLILNNPNDPNQIPQKGDIMVYSRTNGNGNAGHIDICYSANLGQNYFQSFSQNSPNPYCEIISHVYDNSDGKGFGSVLGWIRKKQNNTNQQINNANNMATQLTQDDINFLNSVGWEANAAVLKDTGIRNFDYVDRVKKIVELEGQLNQKNLEVANWQTYTLNNLLPDKDTLLADYPDLHQRTSFNDYRSTVVETINNRAKIVKLESDLGTLQLKFNGLKAQGVTTTTIIQDTPETLQKLSDSEDKVSKLEKQIEANETNNIDIITQNEQLIEYFKTIKLPEKFSFSKFFVGTSTNGSLYMVLISGGLSLINYLINYLTNANTTGLSPYVILGIGILTMILQNIQVTLKNLNKNQP